MWEVGHLYDFTLLMKNQVSKQLIELLRYYKITEVKLLFKVLKQIIRKILLEFKVLIWEPRNELQLRKKRGVVLAVKIKELSHIVINVI